jgi:M6 family metalloprotease-like protein
VVFDPAIKSYFYATLSADGNEFESTGKAVGKVDPRTLGVKKNLEINPSSRAAKAKKKYAEQEAVVQQEARWKALKEANKKYRDFKNKLKEQEKLGKKGFVIPLGTVFPDTEIPDFPMSVSSAAGDGVTAEEPPIAPAPPNFTMTGDALGLMILVDFSDLPGTVVTQAQVDDYCNKPNYTGFGNSGSIYDYWFIQSGGKLRYNNSVTYYVRVPQPRSYYNNTAQDSGLCGRLLLNDALTVLLANGFDFSKLTTKSGGNIRACNVFFAGPDSGVWAKGLWPHRWVLSPSKAVGGGKYIYDYQITNIGTTPTLKIGTVCHENGHMLMGYPDLYSYDGNAANVGNFSLMASGNYGGSGYHPTHVDPYLKEASGWMDIVDLNSASKQRCTVQADGNLMYRYPNPSKATEYFTFEVRDNTGYEGPYGGASGSVNPSTGLMAYHIYETGSNPYSSIWTDATSGYGTPYEFMIIEANPTTATNSWPWYKDPTPDGNDAFKSAGKSYLSDTSYPNLKFWDATGRNTTSSCIITNISADSSNMTFVVGSGPLSGTPSIILSRSTLQSYCYFGATAPSKSFIICNGQSGTLNYTITDNQTWLSCTPTNGTATTEADVININFSTSGLAAGSYSATITVTDPAALPTTKTITVNLTVTPQPTLSATPASLTASGIEGTAGPEKSFGLNNIGGGSLNYTVTGADPWLAFTPASGTVVGETDTVYVDFDATGLAAGTYNSSITVTSAEASNSPLTIPVTFTVQSTDMIVTSPNGGEQWGKGDTRNVTWASSLGGNVKIELFRGASLDTTISANTPNDGSFSCDELYGQNNRDRKSNEDRFQ